MIKQTLQKAFTKAKEIKQKIGSWTDMLTLLMYVTFSVALITLVWSIFLKAILWIRFVLVSLWGWTV